MYLVVRRLQYHLFIQEIHSTLHFQARTNRFAKFPTLNHHLYICIFLQLRQEKVQLEHTLEQEQECLVNKLMRRIEKLETETTSKQTSLDNLRREKVELENTLEQEQEALVNKLWKRMDQLETEKR